MEGPVVKMYVGVGRFPVDLVYSSPPVGPPTHSSHEHTNSAIQTISSRNSITSPQPSPPSTSIPGVRSRPKYQTARPPLTHLPRRPPPHVTLVIPYLGKSSHHLQRILREANIPMRHTSSRKLHSMLHTHKDTQPHNKKTGVYKIPCECGKVYMGDTGRDMDTRLKEHKTSFILSEW